ncbi:MAG: hypothetical protein WBC51_27665 [Vicinamibacterales bacterium]
MRSFATQTEARQFFVEKIVQEAQREGVPLSEDERLMLLWSESAPDSVADPALAERLAAKISDAAYESKIVALLRSSFKRDAAVDPAAKEVWGTALSALSRGDHYVLVMINEAIGRHLKPWWQFW